jgi:predicted nicotinamide N-methyase
MKYRHGQWPGRVPPRAGLVEPAPAVVHGAFDLIVGSDVLYERDEAGTLAGFIARLAAPVAEVWIVDPNRRNRSAFHKNMARHGFTMVEEFLDHPARASRAAYRGRMLTYSRAG